MKQGWELLQALLCDVAEKVMTGTDSGLPLASVRLNWDTKPDSVESLPGAGQSWGTRRATSELVKEDPRLVIDSRSC